MTRTELRAAYDRACIWISDIVTFNWERDAATLQRQPVGGRPHFVHRIARWIDPVATTTDSMDEQERSRLRTAFLPSRDPAIREPDPPLDVPLAWPEITRVHGQSHPSTGEKWVAYTDGSVVQRDGRTRGACAGTFTQGPSTPNEFTGRVVELPLSSTRMEIMGIIVAIATTPPGTSLEIHSDSRAAVHMMARVKALTITRVISDQLSRRLPVAPPPRLAAIPTSACVGEVGPWTLGRSRQHEGRPSRDLGTQRLLGDPMDDQNAPATPDLGLAPARRPSHPSKASAPSPRAG
jgi:hypothetical protein